MEVILAESAGFCFGVKRALDLAEKTVEDNKDNHVYTYGPLIHNEQVVADLEAKGVSVMKEGSEPSDYPKGVVIIRSHGISKEVYDKIEKAGHMIVDATCPFVGKIHKLVREHSKDNEYILVIGDPVHPEVRGITGWIEGDRYNVIKTEEEALDFCVDKDEKICVVSQTTFNLRKFEDLVEIIKQKGYHITVLNTICNATEERQNEALRLSGIVDAMVVIGGRESSNSRKLYEICKEKCHQTFFIQTASELDRSQFTDCKTIGVTAGASTPNYIIQEVLQEWQRRVLTSC